MGSRVSLVRLQLNYFMGVHEFTLEPDGHDTDVFGDNGLGKSTIEDAITWLLLGTDRFGRKPGRKGFDIRTLVGGQVPDHVKEHSVTGVIRLAGGRSVELKKTYVTKHATSRNNADTSIRTNETICHFDGVKVKLGEYNKRLTELLAEPETIRLLMSPLHFGDRKPWKECRDLVMSVVGEISDEDVIASDPDLAELPVVLGDRSLDDARAFIQSRQSAIVTERNSVQNRIDELSRFLSDGDGGGGGAPQGRLLALRDERTAAQEEKQTIVSGGQASTLKARRTEISVELREIRADATAVRDAKVTELQADRRAIAERIDEKKSEVRRADSKRADAEAAIRAVDAEIETVKRQYIERQNSVFTHTDETVCAACQQELPTTRVAAAREAAEAQFNSARAERLEQLNQQGGELAARKATQQGVFDESKQAATDAAAVIDGLEQELREIDQKIESAKAEELPVIPRETELLDEDNRLAAEIEQLSESTAPALEEINATIERLDAEIAAVEADVAKKAERERAEERLQQLKDKDTDQAKEHERLQFQLELIEKFIRTKVRMHEGRIADRFRVARFRMFEDQMNGGLEERCDVIGRNGESWASMNDAQKIQAGLDIIRTLQEHFQIALPVFIDRAESVTSFPEMPCQVIRLVVREGEATLKQVRRDAEQVAA